MSKLMMTLKIEDRTVFTQAIHDCVFSNIMGLFKYLGEHQGYLHLGKNKCTWNSILGPKWSEQNPLGGMIRVRVQKDKFKRYERAVKRL